MEWMNLIGHPAVIAAGVSIFFGAISLFVNRSTSIKINREKIKADIDLAKKKFEFDRQQAVFKRRFELAEQFLADAYRFRDVIAFVRNGNSFSGEGTSREAEAH